MLSYLLSLFSAIFFVGNLLTATAFAESRSSRDLAIELSNQFLDVASRSPNRSASSNLEVDPQLEANCIEVGVVSCFAVCAVQDKHGFDWCLQGSWFSNGCFDHVKIVCSDPTKEHIEDAIEGIKDLLDLD